jgi:hypothetical protein
MSAGPFLSVRRGFFLIKIRRRNKPGAIALQYVLRISVCVRIHGAGK